MPRILLSSSHFIRIVLFAALAIVANQGDAQQASSSALANTSAQTSALPAKIVKSAKKAPVPAAKTAPKATSSADAAPDTETLDGTTVRGKRVDDHPNIHNVFEKAFPQPDGSDTTESTDGSGNRVECIKDCRTGFDCCKTVKANQLSGPDTNGAAGR